MEKQQPRGIDPGGLVQRRPGLFCCISALPTFTRGARESRGGRGGGAEGKRGRTPASRSHLSVVDQVSSH